MLNAEARQYRKLPPWLRPKESFTFGEETFAFDEASVRAYDDVGRMRVELTPISKAGVNPYKGREIPKWRLLGLDPNKTYMMLRDPQELAKAADTFNTIQFLDKHIPVDVENHQDRTVVGTTGTDAVYQHPYLMNSLAVWKKDALGDIQREERKQLSSAYRYDADMTPGVYEGVRYDGVMRNIKGNHVALVKRGRVGPDVLVYDEQPEEFTMAKTTVKEEAALSPKAYMTMGTLHAYLLPLMAQDEAVPDLTPLLKGITVENYKEQRVGISEVLKKSVGGKLKLAQDVDIDDVDEVLMALDELPEAATAKKLPHAGAADADKDCPPADKKKAKKKADKDGDDDDDSDGEGEGEGAMDGEFALDEDTMDRLGLVRKDQLAKVVDDRVTKERKTQQGIYTALRVVHPYVGELAMDEFDSDHEVFKAALDVLKVDVKGVHPSAFKTILEMQPKPGEKRQSVRSRQRDDTIAMDAADGDSFNKMFPDCARIINAG